MRPCARAGRPLPPLFNWLEGELDTVPKDIQDKLKPKAAA
jgi:hypothetical protein